MLCSLYIPGTVFLPLILVCGIIKIFWSSFRYCSFTKWRLVLCGDVVLSHCYISYCIKIRNRGLQWEWRIPKPPFQGQSQISYSGVRLKLESQCCMYLGSNACRRGRGLIQGITHSLMSSRQTKLLSGRMRKSPPSDVWNEDLGRTATTLQEQVCWH